MAMTTKRTCPLCGKTSAKLYKAMKLADFDGENPLCDFSVVGCECGFIFNDLAASRKDIENFYNKNELYPSEMGVGSGGSSVLDKERYKEAVDFIAPFLPRGKQSVLADVGCAKGGFLRYLKDNGFTDLRAVDLNPSMIVSIVNEIGIQGNQGSADALGMPHGSADVLVYSNILEHLFELDPVVREAKRVISKTGIVVVEVPDASRYVKSRIADFYWFSQCEHINHFDANSLQRLLGKHGFSLLAIESSFMRLGVEATMPVIRAIFALGNNKQIFEITSGENKALAAYIDQEEKSLFGHRLQIKSLKESRTPVYIWGRGLELQCLYSEGGLRDCFIQCIIDKNPVKQGPTIDGLTVASPACLENADAGTAVAITSALHHKSMTEHLQSIHYPGQIVYLV